MKLSVGLTFVFAALSASAQVIDLGLIDESSAVNGSWHGDIYNHPGGFQEIGGLGLATSSGIAFSSQFGPFDLTQGHGTLGDFTTTTTIQNPNPLYDPSRPLGAFNQPFLAPTIITTTASYHAKVSVRAAAGQSPANVFRVTLYDTIGGSSSWTLNPVGAQPGQFFVGTVQESSFSGNLDWSKINQVSIGGLGGDTPFHAAFDTVTLTVVPEPASAAAAAGILLLTFGLCRRLRKSNFEAGAAGKP